MSVQTAAILICLCFILSTAHSQNTDTAQATTVTKVEKEGQFLRDDAGWKRFIERNLNPNIPVENGAPAGVYTVYIQFVITRDGTVSDVKALTNFGYGMEAEAIRIMRKGSAWGPATIDSAPVKVYRKLPVTFHVLDESFALSTYTIYADRDNEITINAGKLTSKDLKVTVSPGTITLNSNGNFIIHVTGTDRVMLNIRTKKKNKKIGVASLEVR